MTDRLVWITRQEPWTPSSSLGLLSFSITFCTTSLATAVVNAGTNIDSEIYGLAKIQIVRWKNSQIIYPHNSHKFLQQTFLLYWLPGHMSCHSCQMLQEQIAMLWAPNSKQGPPWHNGMIEVKQDIASYVLLYH